MQLAVGSEEFWAGAQADIDRARRRVLIQAMTFEGDQAGRPVAQAIARSGAADRRVLVDDYTRHVINDRFLAASRDPQLLAEAEATRAMFAALIASGAGLRLTNPVGRNPLRYAARNHKKLLVIDDVAWIGGINFSDHNFAWHDMMVRIESAAVADWLAGTFECDWQGRPARQAADIDGVELCSIDGTGNGTGLEPVLALIAGARHRIDLVSAYPTFPFVDAVAEAASRGVAVRLLTPRPNNKPIIRDYLLGMAARSGIDIRLTPMMTHAKALLVDGSALVVGSCNFDFVSHRLNAEYLVTLRDPGLIAQVEARLIEPLLADAQAPLPADYSRLRAWRAAAGLKIADAAISRIGVGPRIADWK